MKSTPACLSSTKYASAGMPHGVRQASLGHRVEGEPARLNEGRDAAPHRIVRRGIFQVVEGTLDEPIEAVVVDLKSGKKFGNEVKHASQLQLYALGAFKRFPTLDKVYVEIWYVDQDDIKTVEYTRRQALGFQEDWDRRFEAAKADVIFEARPSESNCKWCPYKASEDGGTGHCEDAYRYSQPVAPPPTKRTKSKAGSRSRAG